ncbi:MAG: hypothetical protein ACK5JR_10010 [Tropicimonas sp.]
MNGTPRRMAAALADYPERPVQLIVPYPAGGGTDIVAPLSRTMRCR